MHGYLNSGRYSASVMVRCSVNEPETLCAEPPITPCTKVPDAVQQLQGQVHAAWDGIIEGGPAWQDSMQLSKVIYKAGRRDPVH